MMKKELYQMVENALNIFRCRYTRISDYDYPWYYIMLVLVLSSLYHTAIFGYFTRSDIEAFGISFLFTGIDWFIFTVVLRKILFPEEKYFYLAGYITLIFILLIPRFLLSFPENNFSFIILTYLIWVYFVGLKGLIVFSKKSIWIIIGSILFSLLIILMVENVLMFILSEYALIDIESMKVFLEDLMRK